ncbi:MAG: hypothetical protein N2651_01470 [Fimbriimonadales bacterium]|nr:hypothetical protein [Fimbriimonadales bacterium]
MKATLQKRLGWALVGAIVIGASGAILSAIAREDQQSRTCFAAMGRMATAFAMYQHDFDERMPLPSNWSEAIICYYGCESSASFYESQRCPKVPQSFFGAGYAMVALPLPVNQYDPERTPMLFETVTIARNAYATEVILPDPPRHKQGNNIAFLRGGVKTLPRSVRVWKYQPLPTE